MLSLRVVAVHTNIPQTDNLDPDAEDQVLAQIEQLTKLALLSQPAPQLVLWPESAIPRGMFAEERNFRFVMDLAQQGDFGMLLGTVDFDPAAREDYNTALLLTGRGSRRQSYRKMHLVPSSESIFATATRLRPFPSTNWCPAISRPGREYTPLHLSEPSTDLAALICFEDTLGDLTRKFALRGDRCR